MKLSVIIPTWNRKENILKTVRCLENQIITGNHSIELILIDDGSDDGTLGAFMEQTHFAGKIKLLYLPNHEGWNASKPRNLGARISDVKSDALYFLDSDVLLPPNRLQLLIEAWEKDPDPNRVIIGPYHYLQKPISENLDGFPHEWYKAVITDYNQDIRWDSFNSHPVESKNTGLGMALACFGGSLLIPRHLFFKTGGYDESVTSGMEDGEFGLTLWETGATFSLHKEILGWHHPHEIVPGRTSDIPGMIDYIDKKHKMDLVQASGTAMRQWGHEDWIVPQEWIDGSGYKADELAK